jgi:hypothetical protein
MSDFVGLLYYNEDYNEEFRSSMMNYARQDDRRGEAANKWDAVQTYSLRRTNPGKSPQNAKAPSIIAKHPLTP